VGASRCEANRRIGDDLVTLYHGDVPAARGHRSSRRAPSANSARQAASAVRVPPPGSGAPRTLGRADSGIGIEIDLGLDLGLEKVVGSGSGNGLDNRAGIPAAAGLVASVGQTGG
jgi:hypothetical protein